MRPLVLTTFTALAAALLGACASGASMDAAYDQSLAPWRGATREALVAAWGQPRLEAAGADGKRLTYVVHHDFGTQYASGGYAAGAAGGYAVGTTGGGRAAIVSTGMPLSGPAPVTCTTHFLLKDDHVVSWTFDGIGCGAPAQ